MKSARKALVNAAVMLLACAPAPAYSQAATLRHDPFVRPAAAQQRLAQDANKSGSVPAREERWNPELRAVMLAGASSMANVDGTVLRIGEEINGYRLVEVHDGEALFSKGAERLTVSMRRPDAAQHAGEKR